MRNIKIIFRKLLFIIFVLTSLNSCRTESFLHTQEKIKRLYNNYQIYLNGEKIDVDTVYLDRNNIKTTEINKSAKTINFIQKKKDVEYFSPQKFVYKNDEFKDIIINGQIASELKIRKVEIGAIKDISILREKSKIYTPIKGDFLIIKLK